jgi:outer membrane lipoprotein-sorting protein
MPAHSIRVLSLFAAFVGMSCVAASATKQDAAIAAFDRSFADVNDYTCILHVHEAKGTQTQDRIYRYFFMKPHYVKTLILEGEGQGSGGVWIGGDQVSGVTIPEGLLPGVIDDYASIPGTLTQADGGKIGGIETDRLQLMVADPASNHDVTEQILYLSKETHWPIRQILYSGSQVVLDEWVEDLRTNVGLTQSDFPF